MYFPFFISKIHAPREVAPGKGGAVFGPARFVSAMMMDVVFCRGCDQVPDIWAAMKERRLKHIPVFDAASVPNGPLNARDALAVFLVEVEQQGSLLRRYIMCFGYQYPRQMRIPRIPSASGSPPRQDRIAAGRLMAAIR